MKFNAFTTLAVAAVAQANIVPSEGPAVSPPEDLAVFGLLKDVGAAMANADNHVLNFEDNPGALHEAGFALIDTLECGAKVAAAMPPLSFEDVIDIADSAFQVSAIGTKFLTDLEGAAPLFAAFGLCNFAYEFSLKFAEASNKLYEANLAKFPPKIQAMAADEISDKNDLFAEVQAALAPGACVNHVEPGLGGGPGLPDQEPSVSTSIVYHTGTGLPGRPTPPPGVLPGGNQTEGHHNRTHSGHPPKPVIGSAIILGSSWSLSLLPVLAGVFML